MNFLKCPIGLVNFLMSIVLEALPPPSLLSVLNVMEAEEIHLDIQRNSLQREGKR